MKESYLCHHDDDHQDTRPNPSSFTHPITCITEGRFSSGGSPMEEEDLLRTAKMGDDNFQKRSHKVQEELSQVLQ